MGLEECLVHIDMCSKSCLIYKRTYFVFTAAAVLRPNLVWLDHSMSLTWCGAMPRVSARITPLYSRTVAVYEGPRFN